MHWVFRFSLTQIKTFKPEVDTEEESFSRPSGGINTQSHIGFCSDPETFTDARILWIHLHSCSSTWLQQWSAELTSTVECLVSFVSVFHQCVLVLCLCDSCPQRTLVRQRRRRRGEWLSLWCLCKSSHRLKGETRAGFNFLNQKMPSDKVSVRSAAAEVEISRTVF